jgi:hypothetical protein
MQIFTNNKLKLKLNPMKILILGALIMCSLSLNAQQFVTSQEAQTILSTQSEIEKEELDNPQIDSESALFAEMKYNVKSYQLVLKFLDFGHTDIASVIKRAVFTVKDGGITEQEYNSNNIIDPELARIKDNLETILTQ